MAHEARPNWYGRRWRKRRAAQLSASPFCTMCEAEGVYTIATVADHIDPHRGDPVKFWQGALQSLCKRHHDRDKKLAEAGNPLLGVDLEGWPIQAQPIRTPKIPTRLRPSAIPLTIVCGAPGSGKSTYVREHAAPGDTVIDLDEILARRSSRPEHHAGTAWLGVALEERDRLLRALHTARQGRAWFIVTAPDPSEREAWAERLGGELVVLNTPPEECLRRIKADPSRPPVTSRLMRAIRMWR